MICKILLLLACCAASGSAIEIKDAWVQAVPPGSSATAAFLTIVNDGAQTARLTGGSAPKVGSIAPMVTTREVIDGQEVMGMNAVATLDIAAGETRTLKPGGDHLMLMELESVPKVGETIELTLTFEPAHASTTITVPVKMTHE